MSLSAIKRRGRKRGQKTDLVVEIRDVLRQYTYGKKTLAEYFQNAEDAKATQITFYVDYRENVGVGFSIGPSLIIYNDGIFTEDDLENLMNFKNSKKRYSMENIGKFGQGFVSSFHIGDLIEIVSNDFYQLCDPQCSTELVDDPSKPGFFMNWQNMKGKGLNEATNLLEPFFGLNVFNRENFPRKPYEGTMIRIKLRSGVSRISDKTHTPGEIEKLLLELCSQFEKMMLFQMQLKTVTVARITKRGAKKILFKTSVRLSSTKSNERRTFIGHFSDDLKICLKQNKKTISRPYELSYPLTMEVSENGGKKRIEEFYVSHKIDHERKSFEITRETKPSDFKFRLLPHVSLCVNLTKLKRNILPKNCEFFLVLPLGIRTRMPFHINCRFQVTPNRRDIIINERNDERSRWNHIMLEELFPKLYVRFLFEIRSWLKYSQYCRLFPTSTFKRTDLGKIITKSLVVEMMKTEKPIFLIPNGKKWTRLGKSIQLVQTEYYNTHKLGDILKNSGLRYILIPDEMFNMMKESSALGGFANRGMTLPFFISVLEKCNRLSQSLFLPRITMIWKVIKKLTPKSSSTRIGGSLMNLNIVPVNWNGRCHLVPINGYKFVGTGVYHSISGVPLKIFEGQIVGCKHILETTPIREELDQKERFGRV